jgi:hypothetical protein
MSWIDDAKKEAEVDRQVRLTNFHEIIQGERIEIEKVLDEARRQGLTVSNPEEGYFLVDDYGRFSLHGEDFGFNTIGKLGNCYTPPGCNGNVSWAVVWTIITNQPRKSKMAVLLGTKNGKCTVNSSEVETGIKKWLVREFSI